MSILLSIGLVVYIILLIISCKNKGNKKIQIATQLVQERTMDSACGGQLAEWTLDYTDSICGDHCTFICRVVHLVVKK